MTFKPEIIKVDGEEVILEKEKITDIFKFHQTPYICTGLSGGGKTTLAIDLIYTFAKECSNVYYITATKESLIDDSISQIPKCFRREPTYDNIAGIWQDIVEQNEATNAPKEKLNELLIAMYGEQITKDVNDKIEEQKKTIISRNTKLYKSQGIRDDLISEYVKDDLLAFDYELKRRIILYGINDCKNKKELDEKLTVEQSSIVNALVSKPTQTLLIFDDITKEIEQMKMDKNKVFVNDLLVTKSQAFQSIITDILTRARHFNCIVVFFVHTIDLFDGKDKIDRLIMFDESMTQKLQNLKSFNRKMKKLISAAADKVFKNPNNKHMFLYYAISSNHISAGKASLHVGEKLKLSESCNKFKSIYDSVLSGFKSIDIKEETKQNETNEEEDNIDSII